MEGSQHPLVDAVRSTLIDPIVEMKAGFGPFVEMTEKVIDQKSLLLSPPEFMINPNYNETLAAIALKRNEAYDEIMSLYREV